MQARVTPPDAQFPEAGAPEPVAAASPPDGPTPLQSEEAIQVILIRSEEPASDLPTFRGYRTLKKLGEGTYGQVWLAEEEGTGIKVAVKSFLHRVGERSQFLLQEIHKLAMVADVRGIVQLKDTNLDSAEPYYVMQFAEEGTLAKLLADSATLAVPEALALFQQIVEALAYVHAKGIRHCDLKPSNILLDALGKPMIADFGQAQLASSNTVALGTFFYMAPEQADLESDQIPDTRWDVYGLGALYYAMVCGEPPRDDHTLREEINQTAKLSHQLLVYRERLASAKKPAKHHHLPGSDRQLEQIIDKCLAIDPIGRYGTAGDLLAALESRRRWLRYRPLVRFALIASALLVLAEVGFVLLLLTGLIPQARNTVVQQQQESDETIARLAANVVQEKLHERIRVIEKYAGTDPQDEHRNSKGFKDLLDHLRNGNQEKVQEMLQARHTWTTHGRQVLFPNWSILDKRGTILALVSPDQEKDQRDLVGKNFAWRDYFSGAGNRYDQQGMSFAPIQRTHISEPFVPRTVKSNLLITVSAPIKDNNNNGETLAVLAASFPVSDLYQWLTAVGFREGFPVLLNEKGQCLLHKPAVFETIRPTDDHSAPAWASKLLLCQTMVQKGRPYVVPRHLCPIDNTEYLVSGAECWIGKRAIPAGGPEGYAKWWVMIQTKVDKANEDVRHLEYLLYLAALGPAALCLLIPGAWYGLYRHIRTTEARTNG